MEKSQYTIIFSIFYIFGVISFLMGLVVPCAVALLAIIIVCLLKNLISNKAALIFYLAFVLAVVNCNFQTKNFDDLSKHTSKTGKITGIVETIPTTNAADKTKFYLKVNSYDFQGGESFEADKKPQKSENANARTMVTLYGTPETLSKIKIADKIELYGKLRNPMQATNPSQFDYKKYLKYRKTFSTFYAHENSLKIFPKTPSLKGKFLQKLSDKRTEILEIHKKYLKSPNLEVLGGIVFGDDAINPPDEIKTSFINSGLLHILAASGMNVSIIFGIWFFLGMRLRMNRNAVILIGAMLVLFYTLMTGMGPSVLRAALMIEFVLLGKLINRSADSIALIFFVCFLMLLYNPFMITDVGFQLSFVVTFALMYFCPPILTKIENKFAEFLVGSALVPLVAQLFAAPIQMFYFNTFSTYSILANLAITPFIMIISFLGFVASIFAMIPMIADKICMVFDTILNPVVTILVNISYYFANLPNSLLITSHPSYLQIILYYALLLATGVLIRKNFADKKLFAAFLVIFLAFGATFIKINDRKCEIIAFDVGNADSFLMKTPDNKHILIDTAHGSLDGKAFSQAEAIMGKYLKDNGVKEIELLILTHFDADHAGGAVDLMKMFKVKKVLLSESKEDSKTTNSITEFIEKSNQPFEYAQNNKKIYENNGVSLKTFTADFKNNSDNENSTITLLSYGNFDMLFMADAGEKSFEKVKKDLKNDKIEILKSGHHGAAKTVSDEMLKAINPDAAIISTGINVYGHPSVETLKILAQNDVKILRTDINMAIKINTDGKTYEIETYNNENKRFSDVFSKQISYNQKNKEKGQK